MKARAFYGITHAMESDCDETAVRQDNYQWRELISRAVNSASVWATMSLKTFRFLRTEFFNEAPKFENTGKRTCPTAKENRF